MKNKGLTEAKLTEALGEAIRYVKVNLKAMGCDITPLSGGVRVKGVAWSEEREGYDINLTVSTDCGDYQTTVGCDADGFCCAFECLVRSPKSE